MARFRYKHIQSTLEDKIPSDLLDGELAVNRFKGKEKIFLKNANNEIISFSSDSLINKELENKANVSDFSAHTANTEIHVTAADKEKLHTHSNKSLLDSISGGVGTMAYENTSSYSSATEVDTALSGKSNTGHTHASNEVTAMTNYTSGVTISPISTSDTLNTAIGKLEHSLGGIKLVALSQAEYDVLTVKDPTTLYIVI